MRKDEMIFHKKKYLKLYYQASLIMAFSYIVRKIAKSSRSKSNTFKVVYSFWKWIFLELVSYRFKVSFFSSKFPGFSGVLIVFFEDLGDVWSFHKVLIVFVLVEIQLTFFIIFFVTFTNDYFWGFAVIFINLFFLQINANHRSI